MTITPTPLPISGLEFGGKIEVGKRSCGYTLAARGYVGINIQNVNEDYFYADFGPVTFQKFLDAFCINVHPPKPLADSSFPNGFKASYSLLGSNPPHAGTMIPAGYHFKGTLNFLGLSAFIDVHFPHPKMIAAKINLPPLTIGDVLKMYKSNTDTKAGPCLNVNITAKEAIKVGASGYVKVFGISVKTELLMTSSKYQLEITGKFLNLFVAQLRIYSHYSKCIICGSYMVEGWFKDDLFDEIAKIVRDALSKAAKQANKHIKNSQNKIKEEKTSFNRAIAKRRDAIGKVNDAKIALDFTIGKIEHARKMVDGVCQYKPCGLGMVDKLMFDLM